MVDTSRSCELLREKDKGSEPAKKDLQRYQSAVSIPWEEHIRNSHYYD